MPYARPCRNSRGNILFLILLAVVLFAALSYAVTAAMRGGEGKSAGSESAELAAADLLNYFVQIDTAVQRMMLTGGVKDYELNFYYLNSSKFVYGVYDNTNCTESRCRVFDPNGGGVGGRTFEEYIRSPNIDNYKPRLYYVSVPNVGTSKPDIVLSIQGIDMNICKHINSLSGYMGVVLNARLSMNSSTIMYQFPIPIGAIPDVTAGTNGTISPPSLTSKGTFCTCYQASESLCESASAYEPSLYHVIVAR